jgi:hypothetical protein
MNKYYLLPGILFFYFFNSNCQISKPGLPEGYLLKTKKAVIIPYKELNAIDTSKLIEEDRVKNIPNRYGVVQQLTVDIKIQGARTDIAGKGTIWQYEISSPQAYSLGISFGKFFLPEGASVFIYDKAHSRSLGAFTNTNNNSINLHFRANWLLLQLPRPTNPP